MSGLTIFVVALALGTDAFSLALGMGFTGLRRKEIFLFPFIVAVFHVVMPMTGIYAGKLLGEILGQVTSILGGAILLLIGARTLYNSLSGQETQTFSFGEARGALTHGGHNVRKSIIGMLFLATGVSIDALSVGFGLGTSGVQIIGVVLIMGLVAGILTGLGLFLGNILGGWIGKRAETVGGLILLIIGFKIML